MDTDIKADKMRAPLPSSRPTPVSAWGRPAQYCRRPQVIAPVLSSFILVALFFTTSVAAVEAQCRNVAISIAHAVKKKKGIRAAVGLAVYQQNLSTGAITFVNGSTVGFGAGQGKIMVAKGSGNIESVVIDGDISGKFRSVTVTGTLVINIKDRGDVPARLTIAAKGLSQKQVKVKGKKFTEVTGKTTFEVIDLSTNERLYFGSPKKLNKERVFGFNWQNATCGVLNRPGGGLKR